MGGACYVYTQLIRVGRVSVVKVVDLSDALVHLGSALLITTIQAAHIFGCSHQEWSAIRTPSVSRKDIHWIRASSPLR